MGQADILASKSARALITWSRTEIDMGNLQRVFKPGDFPGSADEQTSNAVKTLFEHLCPQQANPELPLKAAAMATVARNPHLALHMFKINACMLREVGWTSRHPGLHQLVGQALDLHFNCAFSFQAHMPRAQANGLSSEQQALLSFWKTSKAFNEEQKLVIEYTLAVASGTVAEELFSRIEAQYGEDAAIELTVAIAWWLLWSMITNATGARFDSGIG
jgi:hypothetical protein